MARPVRALGSLVALAIVAGAVTFASIGSGPGPRGSTAPGELARGGNPELTEQSEVTTDRLVALAEAELDGAAWRSGPVRHLRTLGWAGERRVSAVHDDWEPAVAADPNQPYVYVLVDRYSGKRACERCPFPAIILRRSTDGGQSWSKGRFICKCPGVGGQYDPIVEVVPDSGDVYAVWMNNFKVVFSRSTDHGRTWTPPVATHGTVPWNDKPALAVSDDGQDVYVGWNGPSAGDPFIAQSHDGGNTWTQKRLARTDRYTFAFDGDVLSDGTVVLSESAISYGPDFTSPVGKIRQDAYVSSDGGANWTRVRVALVHVGRRCTTTGCRPDFYTGHNSVSADDDGTLVYLYDGASRHLGPQRIFAVTSTDGGLSWSAPVRMSAWGENASSPAVEATGSGDVRAWYMQTTGGPHAWNVWYRTSSDGGLTWSAPVRISDAVSGARYKTQAGFREMYGDYGEIDILSDGRTIGVWGEGTSYYGPGQVWFNIET